MIIGSFSDIHPQKMVESWLFGTMFYLFLEHLWCTHQFEDVCFSFFSSWGWMPERVCWWLLWWWSSRLLFFWGLITMDFCTFLSNYTGTYTVKDFRHDVHRWVNPTGRIWRFSGQSLRRCFVFWHKKKAIVRIGCVRINQSWWLYPLVNCYITMERSTIFNGYIHYFD